MTHSIRQMWATVLLLMAVLIPAAKAAAEGETTQRGVVVNGNVYGGGNLAAVGGSVSVNIKAGTVNHDVYGGGAKAQTNTNTSETTPPDTEVTMSGGTVTGSVYGGGLGQQEVTAMDAVGDPGDSNYQPAVAAQAAIPANVNGTVTVTVRGGTAENVYGCNNLEGAPQQDVTVNIQGGTIKNNVFGGGNQADAPGQITVNVTGGEVKNDVYGGGALASTNTANWNAVDSKLVYFEVTGLTAESSPVVGYYTESGGVYTRITDSNAKAASGTTYYTNYTTTVNLTGGIVGNAYGGGLGDADTPAYVYGDVTVDVNGTAFTQTYQDYQNEDGSNIPKTGQVFGCNNINGSPKGEVTVHVHRTVGLNDSGTVNPTKPTKNTNVYELLAVYGGGNLAPYEPVKATSESTTDTDEATYNDNTIASTNVIIDGCDLTSIKQVYGGGNAASTPSTRVKINGSYEIDEVFGGGNGKDKTSSSTLNPGAHVGFKSYTEGDDDSKEAAKYGKGVGRVNINGGVIHAVYGGSNTKGNVRRVAVAMLDQTSDESCFVVDEAYGGGKSAPMDGKAILDLGCIPGVGTVYGGARAARVNNDVVLTITNGTYTNVFGGNNVEGDIMGSITVNIEETGCRPIQINNLFGGGNQAPYTTPNGKNDPTINILSCTRIDRVYGGGLGSRAKITGNTNVNINMVKGRWSQANSPGETNTYNETGAETLGVIGHVYGGGYGADVTGNTSVNIGTAQTVTFASLTDNTETQDIDERVKTVEGANITGDVFGGGYGASTNVTGTAHVNIGELRTTTIPADPNDPESQATTSVSYVSHDATVNGNIGGDIYGGSALGTVNNAEVNLYAGKIAHNVFGGGMGQLASGTVGQEGYVAAQGAVVTTKATVNLYTATTNTIYGGCNVNGAAGSTEVNLKGGSVGEGSVNSETGAYTCSTNANVFGGGYGTNTYVSNDVVVNVGENSATTGPAIHGDVYGGGALGHVNGTKNTEENAILPIIPTANATTTVNLNGGTIFGDAYGGGLGQKAGFNGATGDLAAYVGGDVNVNVNGTAFHIAYTNEEGSDGNVGKSGRVFGANNLNGSPQGDVTVTVNKTVADNYSRTADTDKKNKEVTHTYEIAAVYGGGNLADYMATGKKTNVIINGCADTSIRYVYGGGNAAAVSATDVLVNGAYEIEYVFGGGNGKDKYKNDQGWQTNPGANVNGNANTLLKGGLIHEAYGASNERGTISGSAKINTTTGGECSLDVEKLYGAGKNADIEGDLIIILGCKELKTDEVYGGAENANVKGNVELTITSGKFGKVFGGNNQSGAIFGHIVLNIEETGCSPIEIDELYGCGNNAAYSVYGYYHAKDDNGQPVYLDDAKTRPLYKPRSTANDTNPAVSFSTNAHTLLNATKTQYDNPVLNIVSCTRIGKVFGGGLGAGAVVYGNPTVNINMIKGEWAGQTYGTGEGAVSIPDQLGEIGDVYGGGNEANVEGNTYVNIGTEKTVKLHMSVDASGNYTMSDAKDVEGAYITGKVFGGGMGNADNFLCDKAMVGKLDQTTTAIGNTNVTIGNGTVLGTVYGGGEIGRVENDAVVTIGLAGAAEGTSKPVIKGDVFGAGKGLNTHGYAALVRGNATVTVQADAKVGRSVYGGGEIASVGKYTIAQTDEEGAAHGVEKGMPYSLVDDNLGICTVLVTGNAEIGPDNMQMKKPGGPDDTGYVFGAGKGILPYENIDSDGPKRMAPGTTESPDGVWESYTGKEADYLKYIETLALATKTNVTISGKAFIKGSVYGGSENGHVQHDTYVYIKDNCQIGNGWNKATGSGVNARYDEGLFIDPTSATADAINAAAASLHECASWDYGNDTNYDGMKDDFTPYDIYGAGGGATTATDGHTFFGNVFGGGSGLYPFTRPDGTHQWLRSAGRVSGNTNVEITGGHILTSVYGGCELTDVGNGVSVEDGKGKCTVKMSGGTLGVPRTLDQIAAHPVTCYLFGAGKGDQRVHFNQWTNVGSVEVEISGGTIYGSIFGGGEDGHVLGDVKLTVKDDAKIGTWGTSYVDGNVFGGGRGFGGDALTAGVVSGNVNIDIQGGKMLGSIYGGGRLGSVGTFLVPHDATRYGTLIPDDKEQIIDESNKERATVDASDRKHGYITINISGGTIGNNYEYKYFNTKPTDAEKSAAYMPQTTFDADGRLVHTRGGNVFTGCMGRLYGLDGMNPLNHWEDLGKARHTKLTVSGSTIIKSNVYGGGELGPVTEGTEIIISGGTIGTEIKISDGSDVKYTFGSVYGGGSGSTVEELTVYKGTADEKTTYPKFTAALVTGDTKIDMSGGKVLASIYGGGEVASVEGSTDVAVSGSAVVGKEKVGNTYFGGATMGNVYGGGSGDRDIVRSGRISGNTKVTVSGGKIYHNIYGGGAYGSVGVFDYSTGSDGKANGINDIISGGKAEVIVTGGIIGVDGHENGMVFGSSRGDVAIPDSRDDYLAWVNETSVQIGKEDGSSEPQINGSVYGGGENGHTWADTEVKIYGGTIGVADEYDDFRGNVYGGGCGTDTYDVTTGTGTETVTKKYFNRLAGIVRGNTAVTVSGGHVVRNVYGGGAMGSVGVFKRVSSSDVNMPGAITGITSGGKCTVTISGGKIGPDNMTMPTFAGMVFGAGRGEVHDLDVYPNLERVIYVNDTQVNIETGAQINGSVYGGSESGHVLGNTEVNIKGGTIGNGDFSTGTACASWGYELDGAAYDMYANQAGYDSKGGAKIAKDGHTFYGNVFGGGSGSRPYAAGKWLKSAGIVGGNTVVNINGGNILSNVYGGNECTDVTGSATVKMAGGTIGVHRTAEKIAELPTIGHVYGAGKGDKRVLFNTWTNVASTNVSIQGGTVCGSVYGGGEDGHVLGNAVTTIEEAAGKSIVIGCSDSTDDLRWDGNVFGGGQGSASALTAGVVAGNIMLDVKSGDVKGSVYGGGRMASVGTYFTDPDAGNYGKLHTDDIDNHGNITVNLTGGTIRRHVFGGGMGTTDTKYDTAEHTCNDLGISRNTTVNLNKGVDPGSKGCIVLGSIFGCNNTNASPKGHAKVHVFATQNRSTDNILTKVTGDYDIATVFGGGNMADYVPDDLMQYSEVIIEGCDYTHIRQVFGGGNAANTPATEVLIKGTYLIDEVFGGGNGRSTATFNNPGANVGYDHDKNPYARGTGNAVVKLMAGKVNSVYGGSDSKGDIRGTSQPTTVTNTQEPGCCDKLTVDEIYGGGKDAEMTGGAEIVLSCMPNDWIREVYAGAQNADVGNNVSLTITSGRFGRVFGGNKWSGKLNGSITVNIEEHPECDVPIVIGELYGGGNLAPYSIYGYYTDEENAVKPRTKAMYDAMTDAQKAAENLSAPRKSPVVNVRSFTSIGNIFGGGYGAEAVLVGDPTVNINEVNVDASMVSATGQAYRNYDGETRTIEGTSVVLYPHEFGKIGAIGYVYGGGNAAKVDGNTNVNIGTTVSEPFISLPILDGSGNPVKDGAGNATYETKPVVGADIRGNVYGGGNEAEVTGRTNVVIGKEKTTNP